jgi:hypothetical protein
MTKRTEIAEGYQKVLVVPISAYDIA